MKKRIISLLMCLVMAFSIVPAALEAAGDGSTVTLLQDVTLPAGQSYGTVEYKMGMILMDPLYYTSDNGAAIALSSCTGTALQLRRKREHE